MWLCRVPERVDERGGGGGGAAGLRVPQEARPHPQLCRTNIIRG